MADNTLIKFIFYSQKYGGSDTGIIPVCPSLTPELQSLIREGGFCSVLDQPIPLDRLILKNVNPIHVTGTCLGAFECFHKYHLHPFVYVAVKGLDTACPQTTPRSMECQCLSTGRLHRSICTAVSITVTFTCILATFRSRYSPHRRYEDSNDFYLMSQVFSYPNHLTMLYQSLEVFPKDTVNPTVVTKHFFSCLNSQHYSALLSLVSLRVQQQNVRRLERWSTSCCCADSPPHWPLRGWKSPTLSQCYPARRLPNTLTWKTTSGNIWCALWWSENEDQPPQRVSSFALPKEHPCSHQVRGWVRPPSLIRWDKVSHTSVTLTWHYQDPRSLLSIREK